MRILGTHAGTHTRAHIFAVFYILEWIDECVGGGRAFFERLAIAYKSNRHYWTLSIGLNSWEG